MKTRDDIIKAFYILADDFNPPGLRYCMKAEVWFDIAAASLPRREDGLFTDAQAAMMVSGLIARQREHEGLVAASDLLKRVSVLEQWVLRNEPLFKAMADRPQLSMWQWLLSALGVR